MAVEDIPLSLIRNERSSYDQYLWKLPDPSPYYVWDENVSYRYITGSVPVDGQGLPPTPPPPPATSPFTRREMVYLDGRYALNARKISAGTGLTGGGDFTADRTLSLNTATRASLSLADTAVQGAAAAARQVYIKNAAGDITGVAYDTAATASTMVQRQGNGQVTVPGTPSATTDATSKTYVDSNFARVGRAIATDGTYLAGGGTLASDRTLTLTAAAIASLAKADGALPGNTDGTAAGSVAFTDRPDAAKWATPGVYVAQVANTGWPTSYGPIVTIMLNVNRAVQLVLDKDTGRMWTRTATGTGSWSTLAESLTSNSVAASQVYAKTAAGAITGFNYSKNYPDAGTVVLRTDSGQVVAADPTDAAHAATKAYSDAGDAAQVSANVASAKQAYIRNTGGTVTGLGYDSAAQPSQLVQRGSSGQITLPGASPSAATDATHKSYVDAATSDLASNGRVGARSLDVSGKDWNDQTLSGFYRGNNTSNSPDGSGSWFFVTINAHSTDSWVQQTAAEYAGSGGNVLSQRRTWVRLKQNNTWQPWTLTGDSTGAVDSVARANSGGGGGTGTVTSVNSKTPDSSGAVTLTPSDVGAAPTSHTHTASQVSDASTVGRSVLTASDAAAARSAIGAPANTVAVSPGTGLTGGGNLQASRTISLNQASQDGIAGGSAFRASTLIMDASTTTATINSFLAAGGYRALRGSGTLTDSLVIPSGTTLDADGATIIGSTSKNLIQNTAAVPARTVTTGSTTAGSTTLTASGAAFSSSDVGRQVEVVAAGPNAQLSSAPGSWYGTVVSVTNSTTAVLSTPANLTGTGRTVYVYGARDTNIEIFGGTWYPGNKNAISQTQESHGFRLRRCDIINVHDVVVAGTGVRNVGGQYAMSFGDVNRVTTASLWFQDVNSDGIHFQGPASGIIVRDIQGSNSGDDLVAFTPVDGQSKASSRLGDTEGNIVDVEVQNVIGYDVWTHLKLTAGTGPGGTPRTLTKFRATGIHGNSATGAPVNIVDYAGVGTFGGEIRDVFAVGASTDNPQVIVTITNVTGITIDGVHWPATNTIPKTGVVQLGGSNWGRARVKNVTFASTAGDGNSISPAVYVNGASIDYLDIDGTYCNLSNAQSFIGLQIDSALVSTRISIRDHHSAAINGNCVYYTGSNFKIQNMDIANCYRYRGSFLDGTGTSTNSMNITATSCVGGSAWLLLRFPANINISACDQSSYNSGSGVRLYGANASPVVLSVSASSRPGQSVISKDGSQSLRISECLCCPVDTSIITTAQPGDIMQTPTGIRVRNASSWNNL